MAEYTKEEKIQIIEENIKHIEDKTFNIFFFILDTKGNPSGSLEYIYETAYTLREKGYNVSMLHQEKEEFIGVSDWMGERYCDIAHYNVETDKVDLRPCDLLVIPDIFASIMAQVKQAPCKKVLLVQNYNYLVEFMPYGATPDMLGVNDIITTTNTQSTILKKWFPLTNIHVVSPYIKNVFRDNNKLRNLKVNIVGKDPSDVTRIVKSFYWEYPMLKWISFCDLRGMSQEMLSDALQDGICTVWVDKDTNFGYTALQALKCGSMVIAKLPNTFPDWVMDGDGDEKTLTKSCVWFDHIDEVPMLIASIVNFWINDEMPEQLTKYIHDLDNLYTKERHDKEIEDVYVNHFINGKLDDFKKTLTFIKNN